MRFPEQLLVLESWGKEMERRMGSVHCCRFIKVARGVVFNWVILRMPGAVE